MNPARLRVVIAVGLLAVIALSGCGSGPASTPAPVTPPELTAAPSSPPPAVSPTAGTPTSARATPGNTIAATSASSSEHASPTPQASSPTPSTSGSPATSLAPSASDALIGDLRSPGVLTACTNFPVPAMATYDAAGKPIGVNVEIDMELARRLGLTATIANVLFDELIDAVVDGRCDISVSSQNILQSRLARIDMIPYTQGVLHLIVRAGERWLVALLDACGRKVAVQTGSSHVDYVRGTADYAGHGLNQQCASANRPPVDLRLYEDPQVAIKALASGGVDAYIGNDLIALQQPTVFRQAAALPPVKQGIGVAKAHGVLRDAIDAAFQAMIADGTYRDILHRYGADVISIAAAR